MITGGELEADPGIQPDKEPIGGAIEEFAERANQKIKGVGGGEVVGDQPKLQLWANKTNSRNWTEILISNWKIQKWK